MLGASKRGEDQRSWLPQDTWRSFWLEGDSSENWTHPFWGAGAKGGGACVWSWWEALSSRWQCEEYSSEQSVVGTVTFQACPHEARRKKGLGPLALELQEYVGILNAREWCTCRRDIWMGSSARGERGKRHGGVGMRLSVTCQMRGQGEKQKSQCQRGGTAGGRHRVTGPGPGARLPELDPKVRTRALAGVAYARSQSAGLRCALLPTSGQPLVLLSAGVQDASGFRKAHTWERSQVLGISVPDWFLPSRLKLPDRVPIFIQLRTPLL